jgi:hypothetical protein
MASNSVSYNVAGNPVDIRGASKWSQSKAARAIAAKARAEALVAKANAKSIDSARKYAVKQARSDFGVVRLENRKAKKALKQRT